VSQKIHYVNLLPINNFFRNHRGRGTNYAKKLESLIISDISCFFGIFLDFLIKLCYLGINEGQRHFI